MADKSYRELEEQILEILSSGDKIVQFLNKLRKEEKLMEIKLELTRPAKKKGGDRYEAQLVGEDRPLVIYLPQYISRPHGIIVETFKMRLEASDG